MTRLCRLLGWTVLITAAATGVARAQGRGGGAWTTVSGDAQRTSSVRIDAKISAESMQKPGFQFLWKRKLDNQPVQLNSLTQPLLLPNIISYMGFKALAFVGGSSDNVYAIDYDINRPFWNAHLGTGAADAMSSLSCPGGLTAITRQTPLAPAIPGGRGGAPGGRGAGAGGRGSAPPAIAGGRGGGDNVFAISSGGMVHVMNPQVGTDQIPPVKFLPAGARVVGSVLVDGFLYAATTGKCGGAANGVWAVDLVSDAKPVTTFETQGAGIAGATAPTFGTDGTVYVATGSGESPAANAVVALEPKTLKQKEWFSAGASPFTSAPVVFQHKGKDLIVAANKDGRLYVLDSASIGGADHKTPLYRTSPFSSGASDTTGLATWLDAAGTRWIAATVTGPIRGDTKFAIGNGPVTKGGLVAFSLVEENGAPTLQPQWASRDLTSPVIPAVVNGVVFAVSSGQFAGTGTMTAAQRAQRSTPAVLYALDAATGKQLWSSGSTITSFVNGIGPSAGDSQVYVVTFDGTVYAFGMPMER
jgi:outer membrane protein assembly factor BamB